MSCKNIMTKCCQYFFRFYFVLCCIYLLIHYLCIVSYLVMLNLLSLFHSKVISNFVRTCQFGQRMLVVPYIETPWATTVLLFALCVIVYSRSGSSGRVLQEFIRIFEELFKNSYEFSNKSSNFEGFFKTINFGRR